MAGQRSSKNFVDTLANNRNSYQESKKQSEPVKAKEKDLEGTKSVKQDEPLVKEEPKVVTTEAEENQDIKSAYPEKEFEKTPTQNLVKEKEEEEIIWPGNGPRKSKNAKNERVRDASTILSLLIHPDIKLFIKFEAERQGLSMNEYVTSLVRPDFERDKEVFYEYKKYQEGLKKFKI